MKTLDEESIEQIEMILEIKYDTIEAHHIKQYLQELYDWYKEAITENQPK